ncbi:MAG: hypothetical protein ABII25_04910 [bacterium]
MRKVYFFQTITFLSFFFFITIPSFKTSQPIENIVVKCARNSDDMNKCLSCHGKNGWMNMKYIHGPIAMNECRPCHIKPDKPKVQKVKIDIMKNSCDFCHQDDEIRNAHPEISKDGSQTDATCLACHNPHASNKEYFLR